MRYGRFGWGIARVLFGLFYLYAPILILIEYGGQNPPEAVPAAARFTDALNQSGFVNPALIAVLLAGGLAMLSDRWAPVGLLLLAPPIVVIAGFHWFLTHQYLWGSLWPIWLAALACHYRRVYARLWERRQITR